MATEGELISQEHLRELKQELLDAIHQQESDWSWLFAILVFVTIVGAVTGLRKTLIDFFSRQAKKSDNKIDDLVVGIVEQWTQPFVVIAFGAYLATELFPLTHIIDNAAKLAFLGIVTYRIVSSVESSLSFIADQYIFENSKAGDNIEANFRKALRFFLYSAGAIFLADNIGLNISSVVAGFGLGGLAVALAAQNILGDAIASVGLFIDQPFTVGDAVTLNGHTGTIEKVGFKTTKLRSNGGELIVFPNSTVSSATIQNYSKAEGGALNQATIVSINNGSSVEIVKKVPSLLFEALKDQQGFSPAEIYFYGFGSCSFNFEIRYVVENASPVTCRAALGRINEIVLETFSQHNIAGPLPASRVVLEKN